MAFLFNSDAARGAVFREIFARDLPDLEFFQPSDEIEPERGRYLISWTVPDEISRYRNLEVLFSIGAGVDQFKADIVPGQVKLGMLNAEFFASLPAGARLLHVGRGPQLDQAALIEALDSGRLAAAMLDVTDPEPLPRDHPAVVASKGDDHPAYRLGDATGYGSAIGRGKHPASPRRGRTDRRRRSGTRLLTRKHNMSLLITIDTDPDFAPKDSLPMPERLISGTPSFKTWAQDASKGEKVLSGVWEATPGETHSIKGTTYEFCHIISGLIEIEEKGGETKTYRAGDSFVMKPGFVGVWRTIETVRKIYVCVYD